jgi:hypothetical protein
MNRIRIGRPRAQSERPVLEHSRRTRQARTSSGPRRLARTPFGKGAREMMAWACRSLWLAARTVIRAVRMTHHEQVRMWECILLTSGAAPLTAAGPLRWVPSLDGYRLAGSHLPAQDQGETGR